MAIRNDVDYFMNSDHYKNYCLKIMRDNKDINSVPDKVLDDLKLIYSLSQDSYNKLKLLQLDFWVPACYLTYKVLHKEYDKHSELFKAIRDVLDVFRSLIWGDFYMKEPCSHVFSLPERYDKKNYNVIKHKDIVGSDYCNTLSKVSYDKVRAKSGVYKLFNEQKELIYIGKSISLSDRVPSSARERGAFYFSAIICDNIAHMNILEPYLISILEPPLNSEHKTEDKPPFSIPIPKETKLFKLLKKSYEQ